MTKQYTHTDYANGFVPEKETEEVAEPKEKKPRGTVERVSKPTKDSKE